MDDGIVIKDGYILRKYASRGSDVYYRCSNRRDKCPVRLARDNSNGSELLTGKHLNSCIPQGNQSFASMSYRNTLNQEQIMGSLNINSGSTQFSKQTFPIPHVLKNTIDGQEFFQLLIAFPSFSVIFFTKQMISFFKSSIKLSFQLSTTFFCTPFKKFISILGTNENFETHPISFILLQNGNSIELKPLINYIMHASSCDFSKISNIYCSFDKELLNYIETLSLPYSIGLFNMQKLIQTELAHSPSLSLVSNIINHLEIAPKESLPEMIEQLKQNGSNQALKFFETHLEKLPISVWNVYDDLQYNLHIYNYLFNLDKYEDDSPSDIHLELISYGKKLQEMEFSRRIFSPSPIHDISKIQDFRLLLDEINQISSEDQMDFDIDGPI